MTAADCCPDCDLPLATPDDFAAIKEGEGQHLCWRSWNADVCIGERVDWRARALAAEAQVARMQPVVTAADNIVRVKHEAEKVFRTGLSGMPDLVRTSPIANGLAKATAAAGKKLEQAVDIYRKETK